MQMADLTYFENLSNHQINVLSRALAHYIFRNGAVEDLHAEGKLSQNDMMALNKDVHNRIAGLFVALKEGKQESVDKVLGIHALYGSDWDKCTPYVAEFDL